MQDQLVALWQKMEPHLRVIVFVALLVLLGASFYLTSSETAPPPPDPGENARAWDTKAELSESYEAVKEANPATLVVSGPPAPTDSAGCSEEGCGDAAWLEALAAEGAFECADFVGARYTVGATDPSTSIGHPSGLEHHSFYFQPMIRRYYEAAGAETPLAFSQFGYLSPEGYGALPDAFWWAGGTSAAHQAGWTTEAVQMAAGSPMVGMVMIWHLDAADWGGDYDTVRGGYGLIRPDGNCLACEMLRQAYLEP